MLEVGCNLGANLRWLVRIRCRPRPFSGLDINTAALVETTRPPAAHGGERHLGPGAGVAVSAIVEFNLVFTGRGSDPPAAEPSLPQSHPEETGALFGAPYVL